MDGSQLSLTACSVFLLVPSFYLYPCAGLSKVIQNCVRRQVACKRAMNFCLQYQSTAG